MSKKECIRCNETKDLEGFVKDAGQMDGRKNICKTCYNVQNKKWRANNTELNRQIQKEYYHNVVKANKNKSK